MSHPLAPDSSYNGAIGPARWEGHHVTDEEAFREYLRNRVGPRLRDDEDGGLSDVINGLRTTGMDPSFIEQFLSAVPPVQAWEVGEALAECVLQDSQAEEITWPWNLVRDRRTPRASLPGADLVGFITQADGARFLFGEVKTSADARTPPNVMYGGSGMTWQLEAEASQLDIQHALLAWLNRRCGESALRSLFNNSARRYFESEGTAFVLVGVLLRDTRPSEKDVQSRAEHLGTCCQGDTQVRVIGWYLPVAIAEWPSLLDDEEAA